MYVCACVSSSVFKLVVQATLRSLLSILMFLSIPYSFLFHLCFSFLSSCSSLLFSSSLSFFSHTPSLLHVSTLFSARNYVRAVSPYFQSLNNLNAIKPFDLSSNTVSASDPNYYSSSSSFLPLSETIKTPLGVLTKDNFIGNDINKFDNLNSLNDISQSNGFENIDGNEIINQFDQIVRLNENNFSETVNNVISVSALELNEKLASFFHLLNIDINTIF